MASNTITPIAPSPRASDDEILGLTTNTTRKSNRVSNVKNSGERAPANLSQTDADNFLASLEDSEKRTDDAARQSADPENGAQNDGKNSDPEKLDAVFEANPELRDAWHDAKAYREVFSTPEVARNATKLLGDLNRMDTLFYSRRPEDHAELARAVSRLDSQSFASLARAMADLAAKPAADANPVRTPAVTSSQNSPRQSDTARAPSSPASKADASTGLTPAQLDFFHATNASAVQGVINAIEVQVERLLPEGISKSARTRVAGEIYRELDTTLQGNRALGQQMRDAFRSGALDDAHRRAIVSLVTGRARQALPGVAKRVLNEWTNTIVSANQERRARQRTAERRVDISGSGGSNDGRRGTSSRDIDYGRMSDADILNL